MVKEINIWENNTPTIKKLLKMHFPTATFRIKTKNFSGGKSIDIYTDLIKPIDYDKKRELELKLQNEGLEEAEWQELQNINKAIEYNQDVEQNIKALLKPFWSVDYDEFSGEILQGANCFLSVTNL